MPWPLPFRSIAGGVASGFSAAGDHKRGKGPFGPDHYPNGAHGTAALKPHEGVVQRGFGIVLDHISRVSRPCRVVKVAAYPHYCSATMSPVCPHCSTAAQYRIFVLKEMLLSLYLKKF